MPRRFASRVSGAVDVPNVILPLATSYNERGVAGYTHTVTNSEDQRKINCFYEFAKNQMTGKGTLTLAKRPGITINSDTFGTSTQVAYLVLNVPPETTGTADVQVIFNTASGLVRSSTSVNTQTIEPTAIFFPTYVDMTSISNLRNIVIQLRNPGSDVAHHVFFITIDNLIANNAWTQINDADFGGYTHRGKMEHMDGFAFILTSSNLIINSDSNSLANWTASSFLAKQIQQDRPVGLARLGNRLLAFGENTVELFYNAGNSAGSPLGRIAQQFEKTGLRAPVLTVEGGTHYYATLGRQMFFIGKQAGSATAPSTASSMFVFDGNVFEKVSTGYIDKILSESIYYSINAIGLNGQQAVAISLTNPATSTQRMLVFFPIWREWFEWTSPVFTSVCHGGYHLGSANTGNRLYSFQTVDNWQDDGTSYPLSTQFRIPGVAGAQTRFMPMFGVDADTDSTTNNLTVEISTDDSQTFSTLGTIDLTQERKLLFEGGSFTKAHIRLSNTNARPVRIHQWLARVE